MARVEMNKPAASGTPVITSTAEPAQRLRQLLAKMPTRVIACSGGIDSMLLATLAGRLEQGQTLVVHALSPAVPAEATARLRHWAAREGWRLRTLESGEFDSEDYLSNPVNRCYYCKHNLYDSLTRVARAVDTGASVCSGANTDDLGEYRPGLQAAELFHVRHPYIEAGVDKATIRALARELALPFAEIPASPCLASRLYTGTRVTAERLRAVEAAEALIRSTAGIEVVRCRVREQAMIVEVSACDRDKITLDVLDALQQLMRRNNFPLLTVELDAEPYRPGRAFVGAA